MNIHEGVYRRYDVMYWMCRNAYFHQPISIVYILTPSTQISNVHDRINLTHLNFRILHICYHIYPQHINVLKWVHTRPVLPSGSWVSSPTPKSMFNFFSLNARKSCWKVIVQLLYIVHICDFLTLSIRYHDQCDRPNFWTSNFPGNI